MTQTTKDDNSTESNKFSQMHFLANVNQELRELIEMTEADFSGVNQVMSQYYKNQKPTSPTAENEYAEIATKIDLMVQHLQYMDVFRQRVEHLISVHQQLIDEPSLTFKESLFHLHVFQSMTIQLDLFDAISSINQLLIELKKHLIEVVSIELSNTSFFKNTKKIKAILLKTITELREAGGDKAHLPIPALTISQVQKLNSVYSMESERIVLLWFLDVMPHGSWDELALHYQKTINQVGVDSTELF